MKSPRYYQEKSADSAIMTLILVKVFIAFAVGCFGTARSGEIAFAVLCGVASLVSLFCAWVHWRIHLRARVFADVEARYQPVEISSQNVDNF